ncbi:lipoprotein-releasing system permease protein [Chitinophaga terrae (ex Kim and Jung 2007)]|uniref:Lipoprotein-releasing system permease protein n=1 Tax=Chitinophaga terrae (ex Kim and Jung 2007) TaxID=408074 RepID=A0A1H4A5W7_9BACT|nr:FtsX-like permease family protein [Chitinophaga terrae (ex Kim and Jung 2007)]MDQ0106003.1 lipoprotein-releasing system permease protein [Chitinophaga terrae (ex Kim and Jung 2007)]GEP90072.1 permease [Chitinophaga terrae (ex Kim and Jung 2007)]SEA31513.1 lipoprotein-releasing system permease protein [Chitinophaga terrae (ex Kim and Jung 2007)]
MRLSFFVAKRIAFNKGSSFSKFIINIAVIATAISVAVMILATSLVNGFKQVVQEKVFNFWGHIHITRYQPNAGPLTEELPFPNRKSLTDSLHQAPGIRSVSPYATKSALLKSDKETEGIIFKGVTKDYDWNQLKPFIKSGHLIDFNDSAYSSQILISEHMANELQLKLNDRPIIYFVQGGGLTPRARRLTVAGTYKTSIEEYDKTYVIGDLELIRKMNNWAPDEIGGYEIMLKDYTNMDTVAWYINDHLVPDELFPRTIRDIYPNIFDWLGLQDQNELITIIIMTIVAIINMITAILILILERTNMVGILKSLGMRNWNIQKIFVYQAAYIILLGLIIGDVFGLGIAILQQQTGFFKLPEDTYYMSAAAISIHWIDIVLINIGTFVICTVVLLIPSLIIKKITPVKAIQFK